MTRNWDLLSDSPYAGTPPARYAQVELADGSALPADETVRLAVVAATAARYTGRGQVELGWSDGGPWRAVRIPVDLDAPLADVVDAATRALAPPGATAGPVPTVGLARRGAPDDGAPALIAVHDDGTVRYAAEVYGQAAVERFVRHLVAIAAGLDSDVAVGRLPMLAADELAALHVHNARAPLAEDPATLPALVADRVTAAPEAVAVRAVDGEITYAELWRRSGELAARLTPRTLVGVWADRTVECMVGLLGALRAGAAYVALEPRYPLGRLVAVVAAAGLTTVVGGAAPPDLGLSAPPDRRADPDEAAPGPLAGPDPHDLAYVMFTSGSTGVPKGVMVEHANVVNLLRHMASDPGLAPGEVMLGVTTPAFDLSVPDLFLPLVTGATLVLADPDTTTDGVRLAEVIAAHAPDLMQATPSTWRMLLAAGWRGAPGMRIVCGGEGYDALLARTLHGRVAGIWNFYGPTETTVWSTSRRLDAAVGDPIPIGEPVRGTACFVLDERGEPVPPGVRGEIHIAGAGVARGYLDRPDLTSAAFVPCPFPGAPSARMYRTGDLGRIGAGGELTFAGRRDHQVKINGFRVELGEVESVVGTLPGVAQAVAAVADGEGVSRLVCYVTGNGLDSSELRRAAALVLAPQSVPSLVVVLEQFPLTANGKVDRARLPAPAVATARAGEPLDGPFEELVAEVWAEVLSVPAVFADDDVFTLGAYSLDVGRIAIRLTDALSMDVTPGLIFRHSSVRALAAALLELVAAAEDDLLSAVEGQ